MSMELSKCGTAVGVKGSGGEVRLSSTGPCGERNPAGQASCYHQQGQIPGAWHHELWSARRGGSMLEKRDRVWRGDHGALGSIPCSWSGRVEALGRDNLTETGDCAYLHPNLTVVTTVVALCRILVFSCHFVFFSNYFQRW